MWEVACAQRRPARWGRQPRRAGLDRGCRVERSTKAGPVGPATHRRSRVRMNRSRRSTKAGPVGPATRRYRHRPQLVLCGAQRRPARWGRQPFNKCPWPRLRGSAAQRRPARWGRQPNPKWPHDYPTSSPLNEGRPGGAGNPVRSAPTNGHCSDRSTKAGPVGPATPSSLASTRCATSSPLNEGRPGGAGNPVSVRSKRSTTRTGAQRRPARWGRQPLYTCVVV